MIGQSGFKLRLGSLSYFLARQFTLQVPLSHRGVYMKYEVVAN